jgi:hypothetical protein
MAEDEALQTLQEVEAVRIRARMAVMWGWLPLLAFGIAALASTPFTQVEGWAITIYWLLAGPIAMAVTLVGYRRMEMRRGVVERRESLYLLTIAAMFAVALAIGLFADDGIASQVGPIFPVGIGLLFLGVIDGSTLLPAAGALIIGLGIALAVVAPAGADAWAAACEGVVLVATGLIARSQSRALEVGS